MLNCPSFQGSVCACTIADRSCLFKLRWRKTAEGSPGRGFVRRKERVWRYQSHPRKKSARTTIGSGKPKSQAARPYLILPSRRKSFDRIRGHSCRVGVSRKPTGGRATVVPTGPMHRTRKSRQTRYLLAHASAAGQGRKKPRSSCGCAARLRCMRLPIAWWRATSGKEWSWDSHSDRRRPTGSSRQASLR